MIDAGAAMTERNYRGHVFGAKEMFLGMPLSVAVLFFTFQFQALAES